MTEPRLRSSALLGTAVAPGEILQEVLEDRGLTVIGLSAATGLLRPYLVGILQGDPECPIDGEVAARLERVLGVSESLWLALQADFDQTVTSAPTLLTEYAIEVYCDRFRTTLRQLANTTAQRTRVEKLLTELEGDVQL